MEQFIKQAWELRQRGIANNDLTALCEATKLEARIRAGGGTPIMPPIPVLKPRVVLEPILKAPAPPRFKPKAQLDLF